MAPAASKRGASNKPAKSKAPPPGPKPEQLAELHFVQGLSGECSEEDALRVVDLFKNARETQAKEVLQGASEAVARICGQPGGLALLRRAGVVEAVAVAASDPPEAGGRQSSVAVEGLCSSAVAWLDAVDPVDFPELSNIMHFALWLGGVDEDVAVAALAAIERFALHRAEHGAGMLQAGVLNLLHSLLSVHRGPEFVEQVFALAYLLCDLPAEAVAEHVSAELGLVATVAESLRDAPFNMRLQLTGLRLLALWATRLREQEEVPRAVVAAGAKPLLEAAVQRLDSAGFPHAASWFSAVGGRSFGLP